MDSKDLEIYFERIMDLFNENENPDPALIERELKATLNEIYIVGFANGVESCDD